jgi:hypothetical protein
MVLGHNRKSTGKRLLSIQMEFLRKRRSGSRSAGTRRCTWRLGLSMFGDALGDWDRASLEINMKTESSSELRDALEGCD